MKARPRPPLLLRVCAELGAGNITERFIADKGYRTEGYTEGKRIVVAPHWSVVDTILHECLHRLEPQWSEAYVRRTTSWLKNRLTDEEIQTIYDEYQRRKKTRRTPINVTGTN